MKHGVELRPLLRIRKRMLKDYLKEEGQSWREDVTNFEGRFLRARVRAELMPAMERIFPRAVERLVALGLEAQLRAGVERSEKRSDEPQALESLLAAAGLRIRRSHWELLDRVSKRAPLEGEVHLPEGWRLKHQPAKRRWILEKPRG